MLRPGRLGTLLFVDLPGPEERVEILRTLVRNLETATMAGVDLDAVARRCEDFSGVDLKELLTAAGVACLRREGEAVAMVDFEGAMGRVRRSVDEVDRERYRALRGRWG